MLPTLPAGERFTPLSSATVASSRGEALTSLPLTKDSSFKNIVMMSGPILSVS